MNAAAARTAAVTFLAFDYGERRVGVAAGNAIVGTAQPLTTVCTQGDARFAEIARLVAEWRPDALVVGVPFHPDGAAHDNTRRARAFGRRLHGRFGLPVHEVDERYSTTEALAAGAGDADADAVAAAIILGQFLRSLSTSANETRDDDAAA
ncbi:MAG: Holliday junction resolvase RuvX [Rubrivivax sp.]|nr:Holliday junction resolvase RuvX [Rubrivivax sp.]